MVDEKATALERGEGERARAGRHQITEAQGVYLSGQRQYLGFFSAAATTPHALGRSCISESTGSHSGCFTWACGCRTAAAEPSLVLSLHPSFVVSFLTRLHHEFDPACTSPAPKLIVLDHVLACCQHLCPAVARHGLELEAWSWCLAQSQQVLDQAGRCRTTHSAREQGQPEAEAAQEGRRDSPAEQIGRGDTMQTHNGTKK